MKQFIDVTGLNSRQITMIEEIVTALKMASQVEKVNEKSEKNSQSDDEQLKELHQEFN